MKNIARGLTILIVISFLLAVAGAPSTEAQEMERVLVHFEPGSKASVLETAHRENAQIHFEFDELNTLAISLPAQALNGLSNNPNVVLVEPDLPRAPADQSVPYGIDQVEARDVWDANRDGLIDANAPTGSGRMVCIIDSGVNVNHEDLADVDFVGGYPAGWDTDVCGHGTHVAGTIAAMNNTTGVVGVSPGGVSLYILKIWGDNCGWAYSSTLVDAAYRCRDAGADIINMSLTGRYYSSFEANAFQTLYEEGLLSFASAGNTGDATYGYPASYPSVISVAALDQNNNIASFSTRNDQVELAGPGISVYSTTKDGGYGYMSGTSVATPHVAAAAAVVWSMDPGKSNTEIRQALQDTALDLGTAGRDDMFGYGLVQTHCACQALNPIPTAIDLARFEAVAQDAAIQLEWETISETDNLGFNIYRAESVDGPRTRLNADLIPSQSLGMVLGATYQFLDESIQGGIAYYYWLESINVYGEGKEHGPIVAKILSARSMPSRPRPVPILLPQPVKPNPQPGIVPPPNS